MSDLVWTWINAGGWETHEVAVIFWVRKDETGREKRDLVIFRWYFRGRIDRAF
jgi:hypothetical protein